MPELRRRYSDIGIGIILGALAMWFLLDIVAPLIDHLSTTGAF
jgi:hypothetical protein